jgi:excisionase family DNA binding protein
MDSHSTDPSRNAIEESAVVSIDPGDMVLTVAEAARRLRIRRTNMYALVMAGEVRSVTIGKLRQIPAHCLTEYIDKLLGEPTDIRPAA